MLTVRLLLPLRAIIFDYWDAVRLHSRDVVPLTVLTHCRHFNDHSSYCSLAVNTRSQFAVLAANRRRGGTRKFRARPTRVQLVEMSRLPFCDMWRYIIVLMHEDP
jgi:hypothetical protein